MRLERLAVNKIKVFLTFDDLKERGITKDELWQDIPKVHDLFRDMMLEADDELGFKADGPIAVEVFALPAQGMVIIVTKGHQESDFDEDGLEGGYIEMQVTLDESDEVFYEFADIEDVISLVPRLVTLGMTGGTLYSYQGRYYISFTDLDLDGIDEESLIALLAEYGYPSTISTYRVAEYGSLIIANDACIKLYQSFFKART
ncbi:genetic competence negative regulator [Halalkalibacterium halodurans]|uniref:genetic competence negative regulator n=1 Tax=Halalkalibacterium halodurans TaxID=86665 RepID=UPI002E1BC1C1|nr:genetic competence negative regulator [Halalkalibacterium halodurans]